jgi:hypothetical protein
MRYRVGVRPCKCISASAETVAEKPQDKSDGAPMPAAPIAPTLGSTMFRKSYAVLWRDGDGPVSAGKLVLGPTSLRLETGSGPVRTSSKVIRYADLTGVANAVPADRIRSRPTAVLDRSDRERLSIATVDGMGSGREIVERLTSRLTPRTAA